MGERETPHDKENWSPCMLFHISWRISTHKEEVAGEKEGGDWCGVVGWGVLFAGATAHSGPAISAPTSGVHSTVQLRYRTRKYCTIKCKGLF